MDSTWWDAVGVFMCESQKLTLCISLNCFNTRNFSFFSFPSFLSFWNFISEWLAKNPGIHLVCLLLLGFIVIYLYVWLHMDTGDPNSGSQARSEWAFYLHPHFLLATLQTLLLRRVSSCWVTNRAKENIHSILRPWTPE